MIVVVSGDSLTQCSAVPSILELYTLPLLLIKHILAVCCTAKRGKENNIHNLHSNTQYGELAEMEQMNIRSSSDCELIIHT